MQRRHVPERLHSLAQTPQQTQSYPAGVGRALAAGDGLVVVHYINLTQSIITGAVDVKFHYVPKANVQYLANEIFLNQALLSVPAGTSTKSASYTTPFAMKMLGDVSHMHSRCRVHGNGRRATLYSCSTTVATTAPGLQKRTAGTSRPPRPGQRGFMDVPAGTSIAWSMQLQLTRPASQLTFGEHAATNEMCIMSGVFHCDGPGSPRRGP